VIRGSPGSSAPAGPRVVHVILLRGADDVDDQVRAWLTEAFLHASG
jgi:hypothetical protein